MGVRASMSVVSLPVPGAAEEQLSLHCMHADAVLYDFPSVLVLIRLPSLPGTSITLSRRLSRPFWAVLVIAMMKQSIIAFGTLWGLVACHSYGPHGMRVSFPVRQMLRLLSQSISRNIERLSYAQRLHTRKLVRSFLFGC